MTKREFYRKLLDYNEYRYTKHIQPKDSLSPVEYSRSLTALIDKFYSDSVKYYKDAVGVAGVIMIIELAVIIILSSCLIFNWQQP